ncbi:hypothetical protein [Nibribacter koreensis]|uniref:Uncharacterized protein n=1 Tax=Nibribacter koreensis TaxID=1084519 RepID=A0ABP8F697_9BACT
MYHLYAQLVSESQKLEDAQSLTSEAHALIINEKIVGYFKTYYSACRFAISELGDDDFRVEKLKHCA